MIEDLGCLFLSDLFFVCHDDKWTDYLSKSVFCYGVASVPRKTKDCYVSYKKSDDALDKNKTLPTEKQLSYIKGICEVLEIEYKELKTKGEATVWLNHFVPSYKRKCEENELDWEANNSDLMDNYGDWSD